MVMDDRATPDGRLISEVELAAATPLTFSDVYEQQFLPLVRLATLLTGRPEVARDLVQDAFVKLHVKWASVRNPPAYVRRSVVNGARSHHRSRSRHPVVALAEHDAATSLEVDHTLATLDRLNHRERACIVLKYYEDRTERQIAEAVGCRPGSVGPTLQRALGKLRDAQDEPQPLTDPSR